MKDQLRVPFYSLIGYADKLREVIVSTHEVLLSGQYFDEKLIGEFEEGLASYCQRDYVVTTASCTDALFFALLTIGIKPEDKVILPAVSFIATVTPVLRAGAIPVFADVDSLNGLISMDHVEELIVKHRPRAVITVDLFGNMVDPVRIRALEKKYGIPFIADAAQSLGSITGSAPAGSVASVACISFDPTKVIHAFGAGGALLTDDEALAQKARQLRYHGRKGQDYMLPGYNSRLNALQAALLKAQLERIGPIIENRKETAGKYISALRGCRLESVIPTPNDVCNFHKFVLISPRRDELKKILEGQGIQTMIHYPSPLYEYRLFKDIHYFNYDVIHARAFCDKVLSIPLHTYMKKEYVEWVCSALSNLK